MIHAEAQGMSKEVVSTDRTGKWTSELVNRLLARPVPFADTLREMGRPMGWGAIGNGRGKRLDAQRPAQHI